MAEEKSTFTKSFEELLNKSIEANKVFMNEGAKIMQQFGSGNKPDFNVLQNETVSRAFNEYIKLNVNHFNNLVDLGLNFVKEFGSNSGRTESSSKEQSTEAPGFILEKTAEAGEQVDFRFLLDNVKQETVTCQLVHSGFGKQQPPGDLKNFETRFVPQSFELKAGESKPVEIHIQVPENTEPGMYFSKVQVKGFEPSYFSIQLTITPKQKQPMAHDRKKAKPKRKRQG